MREALSFLRSIPRDWLLGITLVLQAREDVDAARAGVDLDDEWRADRAARDAAVVEPAGTAADATEPNLPASHIGLCTSQINPGGHP